VRVGEKMSQWVIFETLHWRSDGDVFESLSDMNEDKPLDIGRLFYAKLRTVLDADDQVEVYWNHIDDMITVVVESSEGRKFESTFPPMVMARVDLIQRADQYVELVKKVLHG
jgi:hypothetical protein